jgi:hypothetical protein
VPGHKLVESFGPDSEYETRRAVNPEGNENGEEVEEEVEYVTLEISGIADVDPNLLTSYRLIVSSRGEHVLPCFSTFPEEPTRLTLVRSPTPPHRCSVVYCCTGYPSCRVWTRQPLSSSCQAQERSSKAATTSSLAPNSYSHTPRVSNRKQFT